jgi:hypothetical protein
MGMKSCGRFSSCGRDAAALRGGSLEYDFMNDRARIFDDA